MADLREIVRRIAEHWSHGHCNWPRDGYWVPPEDAEAIADWLAVWQALHANQDFEIKPLA
jgi:hypothetical protein